MVRTEAPAPGGSLVTTIARDDAGRPVTVTRGEAPATTYGYDAAGNLTRVTEAGASTAMAYDERGNVTAVTDALGQLVTLAYDAGNRLTSVTSAAGATTTYAYDHAGRLSSETDPDGGVTAYGYDALGRLTSTTDPMGGVWGQEWDALWRIVATRDPLGARTSYAYDAEDNLVSVTDPLGASTRLTLDAAHRVTAVTDPLGGVWSTRLDAAGRPLAQLDPAGAETAYTYDEAGRLTSVVDPDGVTERYTWDAAGSLLSVEDASGAATTLGYDGLGRLTDVTDALGATWTQEWNDAGLVVAVVDPLERATTFAYDAIGQLLELTDRTGATTSYTYDADGFPVSVVDPDGVATTFTPDWAGGVLTETDALDRTWSTTYDALGRVLAETDPLGNASTYRWDAAGNLLAVTDPSGAETTYAYDAGGRVVRSSNAEGVVTTYGYDAAGRLDEVVRNAVVAPVAEDPDGPVNAADANVTTRYGYSPSGLPTSMTNPLGATWTTGYTPGGRLAAEVDSLGNETGYTYDARGLLARVIDPDGRTATHTYDALGQLTESLYAQADRADRAESFRYDPLGNVVEMLDPSGRTVFFYDAEGRVTEQVQPGGTISLELTPAGRVAAEELADGSRVAFGYDASGAPASAENPLGAETYAYDEAARLTGVARTDASGRAAISTTYELDPNGRATSIVHSSAAQTGAWAQPAGTAVAGGALASCLPVPEYLAGRTLPGADATLGVDTITLDYAYGTTGSVLSQSRVDSGGGRAISSATLEATYDALDRLVRTETSASRLAASGAGAGVGGSRGVLGAAGATGEGCGLISGVGYPVMGAEPAASVGVTEIAWDAAGNRVGVNVAEDGVETSTVARYDAANRLGSTSSARGGMSVGESSFAYDGAGNRVRQSVSEGPVMLGSDEVSRVTSFTYDAAGYLAGVEGAEVSSTFVHDGLGRVVASSRSSVVQERSTTYTWGGLVLSGQDDSVHGATTYLPDGFGGVSGQSRTPAHPEGSWLLGDALGSVIGQATPDGTLEELAGWGVSGGFDPVSAGWDSVLGYTGEVSDPASGLVSFYARTLDTATGVFTSVDAWEGLPGLPETLNAYAYVTGNPLTLTDTLGYWPSWVEDAKDLALRITASTIIDWRQWVAGIVATAVAVGIDVLFAPCIAATAGACLPVAGGVSGWSAAAVNWAIAGDRGTGHYTWQGFGTETSQGLAIGASTLGLGAIPGVRRGFAWLANRIAQTHLAQRAASAVSAKATQVWRTLTGTAPTRFQASPRSGSYANAGAQRIGASAFKGSVGNQHRIQSALATLPRGSRANIYEVPTVNALGAYWTSWTGVSRPTVVPGYGGIWRVLADGTRVGWRNTSSLKSGYMPTIDLRFPDGKQVKIHVHFR